MKGNIETKQLSFQLLKSIQSASKRLVAHFSCMTAYNGRYTRYTVRAPTANYACKHRHAYVTERESQTRKELNTLYLGLCPGVHLLQPIALPSDIW